MNQLRLSLFQIAIGRSVKSLICVGGIICFGACKPRADSGLASGVDRVDQLDNWMVVREQASLPQPSDPNSPLDLRFGSFFSFCPSAQPTTEANTIERFAPQFRGDQDGPPPNQSPQQCPFEDLISYAIHSTAEGLEIFAAYSRPNPVIAVMKVRTDGTKRNIAVGTSQIIDLTAVGCLDRGQQQLIELKASRSGNWLAQSHNHGLCVLRRGKGGGFAKVWKRSGRPFGTLDFDDKENNLFVVSRDDSTCHLYRLNLTATELESQQLQEGATLCPKDSTVTQTPGDLRGMQSSAKLIAPNIYGMFAQLGSKVMFFNPISSLVDSRQNKFDGQSVVTREIGSDPNQFPVTLGAHGPEQTANFSVAEDSSFVATERNGNISFWDKFRQCSPWTKETSTSPPMENYAFPTEHYLQATCGMSRYEQVGEAFNMPAVSVGVAIGESQDDIWKNPHPRLQGPVNGRLMAYSYQQGASNFVSLLHHQHRPMRRRVLQLRKLELGGLVVKQLQLLSPGNFGPSNDPKEQTEQYLLMGEYRGSELILWNFGNVYQDALAAFEQAGGGGQFAAPLPDSVSDANKKELEFLGWIAEVGLELKEFTGGNSGWWDRTWFSAKWKERLPEQEMVVQLAAFFVNKEGERTYSLLGEIGTAKIKKDDIKKATAIEVQPAKNLPSFVVTRGGRAAQPGTPIQKFAFDMNITKIIESLVGPTTSEYVGRTERNFGDYTDFGLSVILYNGNNPEKHPIDNRLRFNGGFSSISIIACEGEIVSKRNPRIATVVYCKNSGGGGVTFDVVKTK